MTYTWNEVCRTGAGGGGRSGVSWSKGRSWSEKVTRLLARGNVFGELGLLQNNSLNYILNYFQKNSQLSMCLCAFVTTIPRTSKLNIGTITNNYDTLTCNGYVGKLRKNIVSRWPEVSFVEPRVIDISSDGVILDRSYVAPVSGRGSGFLPKRSRPDFSVRWRDRLTRRLFWNSAAYL